MSKSSKKYFQIQARFGTAWAQNPFLTGAAEFGSYNGTAAYRVSNYSIVVCNAIICAISV